MASDLGLVAAAALWPAGDPRIQDRLGNPLSRRSPSGPSVCDQAFVADPVLRHADQFNAVTARVAAHALRPRGMRSWALHEPPIERHEYQDDADVYYQPLPEVVPEEQNVHAYHDGYQREHVKHDDYLSHRFVLLSTTE